MTFENMDDQFLFYFGGQGFKGAGGQLGEGPAISCKETLSESNKWSIPGSFIQALRYSLVCRLHSVKCQIKTLISDPQPKSKLSLDEPDFPLNFRKCGFCRRCLACGCILHVNV